MSGGEWDQKSQLQLTGPKLFKNFVKDARTTINIAIFSDLGKTIELELIWWRIAQTGVLKMDFSFEGFELDTLDLPMIQRRNTFQK